MKPCNYMELAGQVTYTLRKILSAKSINQSINQFADSTSSGEFIGEEGLGAPGLGGAGLGLLGGLTGIRSMLLLPIAVFALA